MTTPKTHSTNYFNTFIEVSEDTKALYGLKPELKNDKKTVAQMQYELLVNAPYTYTSDQVFFKIYALRNSIKPEDLETAEKIFFSKGQPCFRASPLTKSYGFGVHHNSEGRIAIFGVETKEYQAFLKDNAVKKIKAMRTSKK